MPCCDDCELNPGNESLPLLLEDYRRCPKEYLNASWRRKVAVKSKGHHYGGNGVSITRWLYPRVFLYWVDN